MSEIVIYQSADNQTQIEVKFDTDTVWLIQEQLALLFERDQSDISRHNRNVFKEGELDEKSNMQKRHIANSDKQVAFYNLDFDGLLCKISARHTIPSMGITATKLFVN